MKGGLGMKSPTKVGVIGAKGVGGVQGGIETYCAQFYRQLPADDFHVTLFVSRAGAPPAAVGVQDIVRIRAPRVPALETPFAALAGTLAARLRGVATLHIHGIGAAICVPLAWALGLRTVVRYLGPEYRNGKWGRLGRAVLRLGEQFVARFADQVVCLAPHLAQEFARATGRRRGVVVIPNGAAEPPPSQKADPRIPSLIAEGPYVLAVGRLTPQKNFHLLIEAFLASDLPAGCPLVIVGEDDGTSYGRRLRKQALQSDRIHLLGPVFGADLWALYRGCRIFAQASRHEGMSFALLEAALAGADIVASDIPANAYVCQGFGRLVEAGSRDALAGALAEAWRNDRSAKAVARQVAICRAAHNWRRIAEAMEPILRTPAPRPLRPTGGLRSAGIAGSDADGG